MYLESHDFGFLTGTDGAFRVRPRVIRKPDLSFFSWSKFPNRTVPDEFASRLAPDLAVEVLSKSNTPAEMKRKLREYFGAGVKLVWFIDPKKRSVKVYTSPSAVVTLNEGESLDGGDVLPGFTLPLLRLFALLSRLRKGRKKK